MNRLVKYTFHVVSTGKQKPKNFVVIAPNQQSAIAMLMSQEFTVVAIQTVGLQPYLREDVADRVVLSEEIAKKGLIWEVETV